MTFAFHSFSDFLAMGKHGVYVWSSYGFFLVCILALVIPLFMQNKRLKRTLKEEGISL